MALTTTPPYFTFDDAAAILTVQTLEACLDDENLGPASLKSGAALIRFNRLANLACSRVDGFLKRVYPGPFPIVPTPPAPVPANIQWAALLWLKALVYERHTDYVKQYGTGPRKEAMTFCEDMTDSKEWLADLPGGAPPGNAGGIVTNEDPRMIVDGSQGQRNSGDF